MREKEERRKYILRQNKWGSIVLSGVLTVTLTIGSMAMGAWGEPEVAQASSKAVKQLEQEVKELNVQKTATKKLLDQIDRNIAQLKKEENTIQKELAELDYLIAQTQLSIYEKDEEIKETQTQAYEAALELTAAEERVEERDQLLKTRVRSMYESGGKVNYLEVLLGSASFGEFLERLDFLSLIMQQDQKIFEDFINDKNLIEEKKIEIEGFLVQLEGQKAELDALMENQRAQEKDKLLRVAEIGQNQEELAKQEEEAEKEMFILANQISSKNKEIEKLNFDGQFTWPVPDSYRITSHFGLRKDPFTGARKGHNGTDIGAPQGTKIVAASGGIVIVAEYLRGYGNTVIIEHGNNVRTLYGHIRNNGTKVKVGDTVKKGQKIAEVGSTGNSTGPHLHFEVHENGKQIDPMKYLKR
jgi:murein DD-endopeptidase MepM/ murein hydrolase activator NlpD